MPLPGQMFLFGEGDIYHTGDFELVTPKLSWLEDPDSSTNVHFSKAGVKMFFSGFWRVFLKTV